MNEALNLVLAGTVGLLLGGLFFGGLWWTVRRGVSSSRPALLFASSLLLRIGITMAGFYFVGRDHWEQLLSCLIGFAMAHLIVARVTRPSGEHPTRSAAETSHAP